MRYVGYGDVFKKIRIPKGLTLSELEYISGISKSSICQFENGYSMLLFKSLEQVLEAMCVTLLDYSLITSNGEPECFITQFQHVESLSLKREEKKLLEIYNININNV
jgi:Uncharacterized protein conserved in bacteria